MAISVINSEVDGTRAAKVIIEGGSVEEAMSTPAKTAALMAGKQLGLFRPGISGSSGPYPVNDQGEDCTLNAQPGMKYRNDYSLSEGV